VPGAPHAASTIMHSSNQRILDISSFLTAIIQPETSFARRCRTHDRPWQQRTEFSPIALSSYTATPVPPTATLPVTFTWDNGVVGPAAVYSWTAPGLYTLTVTATNPCGQAAGTFVVGVWPHQVYLPLVVREGEGS
jgi:hypothetical protein